MTSKRKSKKNWALPAFASMLVWGIWVFLPKLALQKLSPYSVLFYETIGSVTIALAVFAGLKFKLQKDRRGIGILGLSAALSTMALFCYLYALSHGPVAVVATLTAMYPVIALLLARIFLKERLNALQAFAVCLAMVSIWLLSS